MQNQNNQETILNISIACSLKQDFIALLADDEPTAKLFKVDQNSLVGYFDEVGMSDKYLASIKPGLIYDNKHLSEHEYTEGTSPVEVLASKFIGLSIFDFCKDLKPGIAEDDIWESFIHTDYVFKVKSFDPTNIYAKANLLYWIGGKEDDKNFETLDKINLKTLSDFIRNLILYDTKELTYEAVRECVLINEGEITIDMRKAIKE